MRRFRPRTSRVRLGERQRRCPHGARRLWKAWRSVGSPCLIRRSEAEPLMYQYGNQVIIPTAEMFPRPLGTLNLLLFWTRRRRARRYYVRFPKIQFPHGGLFRSQWKGDWVVSLAIADCRSHLNRQLVLDALAPPTKPLKQLLHQVQVLVQGNSECGHFLGRGHGFVRHVAKGVHDLRNHRVIEIIAGPVVAESHPPWGNSAHDTSRWVLLRSFPLLKQTQPAGDVRAPTPLSGFAGVQRPLA